MNTTIETDRLLLSPMTQAELKQLIEQYRHSNPELSAAYREMLHNCQAEPQKHIWYTSWKFVQKDTQQRIGDAGFKGRPDNGHVEIGYGIDDACQHQGFATEGVQALCQWAFQQEGITAVEAETEPDNHTSQNVLFKNGFTPTGITGKEGPRYIKYKD